MLQPLVCGLAAIMVVPIEVVANPTDWAGWAQALGGIAAILATWILASRDSRRAHGEAEQQKRDRQAAICAIIDLAITTLETLNKEAAAKSFTRGNIGASEDAADAVIATLASIPLLELTTSQIEAVSSVGGHMTTARRRLGFSRNHLEKDETATARFDGLLKQTKEARESLN